MKGRLDLGAASSRRLVAWGRHRVWSEEISQALWWHLPVRKGDLVSGVNGDIGREARGMV